MLNYLAIPEDVVCASKPQTWHRPRGDKIKGQEIQSLEVGSYKKRKVMTDSEKESSSKFLKSTLYNPLRGMQFDFNKLTEDMRKEYPNCMMFPALQQTSRVDHIPTKFGSFPKGSPLALQQSLQAECVMNIYDGNQYPELPVMDRMNNDISFVASLKQSSILQQIFVTEKDVRSLEEKTRDQSKSTLWHKLRKHRITASNVGDVCKRQSNFETLVKRLKTTKSVCTAAMKHGIETEPLAGVEYSKKLNNAVNLFPCGIVLSETSPWIAASPDRKVYNPQRHPQFGLLEIKCSTKESLKEVAYLEESEGALSSFSV